MFLVKFSSWVFWALIYLLALFSFLLQTKPTTTKYDHSGKSLSSPHISHGPGGNKKLNWIESVNIISEYGIR